MPEVNIYRPEPHGFEFRVGTCDANVYRAVVELNEYRLPEEFRPDDLIVDVGAHIGSFAIACVDRGCENVIAFEPEHENFIQARKNLWPEIAAGNVDLFPLALWSGRKPITFLPLSEYPREQTEINTGGGNLLGRKPKVSDTLVPAIDADVVLDQLCQRQTVRLLKLDCEYAEWPILLSSSLLPYQCEAICGEFHEIKDVKDIPEQIRLSGSDRPYTEEFLIELLERRNFKVETKRQPHRDDLGLFFAWRPGFEFSSEETGNGDPSAPLHCAQDDKGVSSQ